jgi:hypothetical protein
LPENELLNDTENVPQSEGKKYSRKWAISEDFLVSEIAEFPLSLLCMRV